MTIRPFLSYSRQDLAAVSLLRHELAIRGAGAWQDVEHLGLGCHSANAIREVVSSRCGGFIWIGTEAGRMSRFIRKVEIPAALARGADGAPFLIAPVFVGVHPTKDRETIIAALGDANAGLLDHNGTVVESDELTLGAARQVAREYVQGAIAALPPGTLSVSICGLGAPAYDTDLTLDWRSCIDTATRRINALDHIEDALADMRTALQQREFAPKVHLRSTATLPLDFLIGARWQVATGLRLTVEQRTRSTWSTWSNEGRVKRGCLRVRETRRGGTGPWVAVAAIGRDISGAVERYVRQVDAAGLVVVEVDGDVDDGGARAAAAAVARTLKSLGDRNVEKHLLMAGPGAVAIFAGASSNGAGRLSVPAWSGGGYVEGITISV